MIHNVLVILIFAKIESYSCHYVIQIIIDIHLFRSNTKNFSISLKIVNLLYFKIRNGIQQRKQKN